MAADAGNKQPGRGPGQPFKPGQSGNPKGRQAGTLNRVSVLAQRLMDTDAEAVILALIGQAKDGDVSAIKLVLERVAPLPRNRPVYFTMPAIDTPADLGVGMGAVLQAVAAGELAPDEAVSIASLIETRRRTIETLGMDARIAALELGNGQRGARTVNGPLHRRLILLEQAPAAGRTVYRVFSTSAEAEADTDTPDDATVVRIITGVPRWSGAAVP